MAPGIKVPHPQGLQARTRPQQAATPGMWPFWAWMLLRHSRERLGEEDPDQPCRSATSQSLAGRHCCRLPGRPAHWAVFLRAPPPNTAIFGPLDSN